jgi:hypothetical protein
MYIRGRLEVHLHVLLAHVHVLLVFLHPLRMLHVFVNNEICEMRRAHAC